MRLHRVFRSVAAAITAIALRVSATDMVVMLVLLLFGFAWYALGLYAAVNALALGSAAFIAGLLSPPLTSGIGRVPSSLLSNPRVILTFLNSSFAA